MTVAVASAVAFLAIGAVNGDPALPTGTSFEALTEGPITVGGVANRDDSGTTGGDFYWYSTAPETDELGAITNDVALASLNLGRPDMFLNSTQSKSLFIETSDKQPLVRTALPNAGASSVTGVTIGSDGIYLDTLVKFTAADGAFTENLTGGDKIAIEYVEHESDGEGDEGYTNFVIRAGLIGSGLSQTNYFAHISGDPTFANFNKDEWHRLTVRTIANVGDGNVGFVIYLDGNPNKTLEYSTDVDAGFGTLDPVPAKFYNSEKHALFPSAIAAGATGGSTISSVAFAGNGFIDDVSFAAEAPQFIKAGEAVVVPFVADAGVTAISVEVDDDVVTNIAVTAAGTYAATLEAQTANFTVNVTVDEANGYTFGSMTVGDAVYNTNPASVTGYTGGDITITTIRNNFNLFDENGDPIQGTFQTLTEAFAEDGVAMIKLAYDYDALAFEGDNFAGYDIDGEIVLDLNGNDLDGGDDSAGVSLFRVADTLTIKDSVGGGSITYDTQYGYAIVQNDGSDVFIGAASGDAGATFNGKLFEDGYEGAIVKGSFDNANNADEGVFLWGSYVDSDSDYELVGDYWVVTPQGGSTTFALTTTGGANATVTTSPANVSALTEETEVTITSTPETGYTYNGVDLTDTGFTYDSESDTISKTLIVSADTEVAVPGAVSGQSSEDWPEGQDLDDVAGKAAGDQFPGITNALATADAKAVATWAEAKGVAYADKGGILPEAFLLNCANTQAAIDEAAANFKVTAITVVGDTVTITPADGADYGNGKVVIEGTATLSPISWHEKTDGDHFFRATLVVKPVVAAP